MKLADTAVGLSEVLVGLLVPALFSVKLRFDFPDALFEFGDDLLSSLEGGGLGLVESDLDLLELLLESLAEAVGVLAVLLFLAELFGELGSIGHGLLAALFSSLELVEGLIQIGLN